MRSLTIFKFLVLVFVVGLYWRASQRVDDRLQEMFRNPDPTIEHQSVASAEKEIKYLREVQENLVRLHHQAHARHTMAAVFVLILTLPLLIDALRLSKKDVLSVKK